MVLRQVAQDFPCKYPISWISDHLQRISSPEGPESGSQLMSRRSLSFKFEFNCGLNFTVNLEYVIILKCSICENCYFYIFGFRNDISYRIIYRF